MPAYTGYKKPGQSPTSTGKGGKSSIKKAPKLTSKPKF